MITMDSKYREVNIQIFIQIICGVRSIQALSRESKVSRSENIFLNKAHAPVETILAGTHFMEQVPTQ
jgi:hypothetical protein